MAPMICPAPGCTHGTEGEPFQTPAELKPDNAVTLLKMHYDSHHSTAGQQGGGGAHREGRVQGERVKRPSLGLRGQSIEEEEFEHFKYLYEQYKERLGIPGDSALLRECLAEEVSKMLFSYTGSDIKNLTEAQLLQHISTCCVTQQTIQARTVELHRIVQDPGQPVQSS